MTLRLLIIHIAIGLVVLGGCASFPSKDRPAAGTFLEAEEELRLAVQQIAADIEAGDVVALQSAHLVSDKFTKFGPRTFERQDVDETNTSEAAFFSSISEVEYSTKELKVDVFDDVAIVTYYPQVSFVRDGERRQVEGRQTLVFIDTSVGWKIVHEHGTIRN